MVLAALSEAVAEATNADQQAYHGEGMLPRRPMPCKRSQVFCA